VLTGASILASGAHYLWRDREVLRSGQQRTS
jgi:hypothetical protein